MTREQAIKWLKTFRGRYGMNELEDAVEMAIKALEKQKAISELQPPTDDWDSYADRLYDLAYLSGYNDGLVAKGSQDNNV